MGQYFSQHAEDASKCLIFCHFPDRSEQRRGTQNKDQLPVHWFPKICQEKPSNLEIIQMIHKVYSHLRQYISSLYQ